MNVISKDELMRGLLDAKHLESLSMESQGQGQKSPDLKGVIPVYKEWGKTPLETLDMLQQKYPVLAGVPLSYAGRLDPLAEGLMLVLVGDTNKDREKYLHLDKVYEVEILLGVATDTGDLFGIPKEIPDENISEADEIMIKKTSSIEAILKSFVGKQQFPYPVYSSKTVQGKPLFQWANESKLGEIEIPKTEVEIYEIKSIDGSNVQSTMDVTKTEILEKVEKALNTVRGDFRFNEIRQGWKSLCERDTRPIPVCKIQCSCSSGTYMRVLAEEIGKKLGVPALAYSIKRTHIDGVTLADVI